MKNMIIRPLQLATLGFALILAATLIVMAALSWSQDRDLARAREHLRRVQAFQRAFLSMEEATDDSGSTVDGSDAVRTHELLAVVDNLIALEEHLHVDTPRKLGELRELLGNREHDASSVLPRAVRIFREIVASESLEQEQLLRDMEGETRAGLRLALGASLSLALLGLLILVSFRWRILRPLNGLKLLVSRLARGEFAPVPADGVDQMLRPLFDNYNHLVMRLEELEQEHRARADSLEQEVRAATTALLDQQRGLARAERLAATGELAASVAHELRNPLAGIQLAVGNLRTELEDPNMVRRIDLVMDELNRLVRLLNELLTMARHTPESSRTVNLKTMVGELLALTRYQLSSAIGLEMDIPGSLSCELPEDRLRQALLNLIINASRAFTGDAGSIVVSAGADGSTLILKVEDDGPGFPPEALRDSPRPFFSTRNTGTGLGLAMVHRFARDLGGRVELANREPHGAAVTIILPDCVRHA